MHAQLLSLCLVFAGSSAVSFAGCAAANDAAVSQDAAKSGSGKFDHSGLDAVLKKVVKGDRVDYAALKADRAGLDAYVDRLAKLTQEEYEKLSRDEQMALWINAYNALTLRSIVDAYPIQGALKLNTFPRNSIRQIDGVWDKKHPVAGREISLNDIENEVLRKQWHDPRIHAAINCASRSCPPLRAEAYTGAALDAQLEEQMRAFLADPTRNTIDAKAGTVEISKVFDWFGDDFGRKDDPRAVLRFFASHGDESWKPFLSKFDPTAIKYKDYDWTLNSS
jgi:hypothetical protein